MLEVFKMPNQNAELAIQILNVVKLIPYGTVATYGQIAKLAGLPKHARMVGRVLKLLDEDQSIPWHRVINAQGRFSVIEQNMQGMNKQQQLLLEEGVVVFEGKVNLKRYQWQP
jgi:methylated-DNA-protein-cysteine methyltransferase-like protein